MKLSNRVKGSKKSITLDINEKFLKLKGAGEVVFNLCSGQLRYRPTPQFVQSMISQMNFLASFQYPPVQGDKLLRDKILDHYSLKRDLNFKNEKTSVLVSNGSKHSLYNTFGAILDPEDEVILLCPYWVSYPEMIGFWEGKSVKVNTHLYDGFTPNLTRIEESITEKTKAIVINSPNNPGGVYYDDEWMQSFARMIKKHPEIFIISDEVYDDLYYYDPGPKYFYQFDQGLRDRTIIINGISKSLSATGLRLGYCLANNDLIQGMVKIQSQTTSGTNSLIQRAVADFSFNDLLDFHKEIRKELRELSIILREVFRDENLSHCWYQTNSAFYFMLDFTRTIAFSVFQNKEEDMSHFLCERILEKTGIALVPGKEFGLKNSARLSFVLEKTPFKAAVQKLCSFLNNPE